MSCGNCNHPNIQTQYIGDVQVDLLSTLPEYLLGERDVEDELSGDTIRSLVRIPTNKILPDGDRNVFSLPASDTVVIPENQVRGGIFYNNEAVYNNSDIEGNAMFIMIGNVGDKVLAQRTGVVTFPNGHEYIVGQQYYASDDDGEPTTNSYSNLRLFVPISSTQLLVNMN